MQAYAAWDPYAFLAYWWELCKHYQGIYGPFYQLSPAQYSLFSAAKLRKGVRESASLPQARAPAVVAEIDQAV